MALQPIKRHVIPPAVEGERMRRYSVWLMALAFILLGTNFAEFTVGNMLWFSSLLLAVVAIVLAAAGLVMRGLQWHYDRIADELRAAGLLPSAPKGREPQEGAAKAASPS